MYNNKFRTKLMSASIKNAKKNNKNESGEKKFILL